MRIYFRCQASGMVGFGHVRRCLMLARALEKRGHHATFIATTGESDLLRELRHRSADVVVVDSSADFEEEVAAYPQECSRLILDIFHVANARQPGRVTSYLNALEKTGRLVVFIDGIFAEAYREEDAPELLAFVQPYVGAETDKRPPCKYWVRGGDYALLDERYARRPMRDIRQIGSNILITFGAADPQGLTALTMKAFSELGLDLSVRVVIGPVFSSRHKERIRQLSRGSGQGFFEIIEGADDLLPHYMWADLAISGSGTSRYEFAACGLPSITTSIYPEHIPSSEAFAAAGSTCYLGFYEDLQEENWCSALRHLVASQERRERMARCGQSLVDGLGTDRLVHKLEDILS